MNDNYKYYYRRRLPHYQPPGYTYFITFRLANSLPKQKVLELINEREKYVKYISGISNQKTKAEKYYSFQREIFQKYEDLLDNPKGGPLFLKKYEIACIVKESIHYRDNNDYLLIAYTIMPNHVHWVITPVLKKYIPKKDHTSPYHVTKILQMLKAYTTRKINIVLKRSGQLWHHESYDHVVRDEDELRRIVNYILYNPVKAGLVENPYDYEWTYLNEKYL